MRSKPPEWIRSLGHLSHWDVASAVDPGVAVSLGDCSTIPMGLGVVLLTLLQLFVFLCSSPMFPELENGQRPLATY